MCLHSFLRHSWFIMNNFRTKSPRNKMNQFLPLSSLWSWDCVRCFPTSTTAISTAMDAMVAVDHLWSECVSSHMPKTQDDFKKKMLDMDEFWQFPCCWAAIDGCHIPIKCPPGGLEACKEYHNFKNFYSIVLMGLVDSHYRFL